MKPLNFEATDFEIYRIKTSNEQYLEEMESINPWLFLFETKEPFCSNAHGLNQTTDRHVLNQVSAVLV